MSVALSIQSLKSNGRGGNPPEAFDVEELALASKKE